MSQAAQQKPAHDAALLYPSRNAAHSPRNGILSRRGPLRILIAPSGFKESLEAEEVAASLQEGLRRVVNPLEADIQQLPLQDGGEGFCKALVKLENGQVVQRSVTGPLNSPVDSYFGIIARDGVSIAVLDMAAAAGLRLVPSDCRDPGVTTTYGVGELIAAALDVGCSKILIGCGDSGTSDGGAGMLQALGGQLLDAQGNELPKAGGAASLLDVASISLDSIHPKLRKDNATIQIEAVCNVQNVLCGEHGVARVYGPQKGATPDQVESLSMGLEKYAEAASGVIGKDISKSPGSGASGGLGTGILLLGGQLRPRLEAINEYFDFDAIFEQSWDFVITAEGSIDAQSTKGKMTTEIAKRARGGGAHVIALAGTIGTGASSCLEHGIEAFTSIMEGPMALEDAISDTPRLLREGAERVMRMLMAGIRQASPRSSPHPSPDGPYPLPEGKGFGSEPCGMEQLANSTTARLLSRNKTL